MATMTLNTEKNGVEIAFEARPDAATLDALKSAGFRWHNARRVWYAHQDAERIALAERITAGEAVTVPAVSARSAAVSAPVKSGPVWDEFREDLREVWKRSPEMVDYCVKKADAVLKIGGFLVTVEKQSIETSFCFGYGYCGISDQEDEDRANNNVRIAETSADYFKRENMKSFHEWIDSLRAALDPETADALPFIGGHLSGRGGSLCFASRWDVLNAFGGSARFCDVPGKRGRVHGQEVYFPTLDEVRELLSAYEAAAKRHEKRVDAYLKRYGTSKVRAWSYLSD